MSQSSHRKLLQLRNGVQQSEGTFVENDGFDAVPGHECQLVVGSNRGGVGRTTQYGLGEMRSINVAQLLQDRHQSHEHTCRLLFACNTCQGMDIRRASLAGAARKLNCLSEYHRIFGIKCWFHIQIMTDVQALSPQ